MHPRKGSKTGTECVSPTPAASWRLQRPIHKSSLLKTHSQQQQPQWVSMRGQKGAGKAQQISVSALQQDLTHPLHSGVMHYQPGSLTWCSSVPFSDGHGALAGLAIRTPQTPSARHQNRARRSCLPRLQDDAGCSRQKWHDC